MRDYWKNGLDNYRHVRKPQQIISHSIIKPYFHNMDFNKFNLFKTFSEQSFGKI